MKKMPKKPFYTNKNHEKCNFSTKKDQIFGLKLCTLFLYVLGHSASASAGLLQNQPAPTSIVVIPSVSRNVVPGDPRNGGHQRH